MADQPSFLARLKQHHLYGVVVAYAVVAAFLIQLVSRVFPYYGWAATVPAVITVLLLGFPVAVVLSWLFIKPKDPAKTDTWQRRHWKISAVVTVAVIVLVVISGFYGLRYSKRYAAQLEGATAATTSVAKSTLNATAAPSAATVIPAKSIAVLPFENLSADKSNAYFADGMQDLILTKLSDIGDLKVISRTSTEQYASHPEDLKTIGQQLGVATILEGSVQKADNQVLINVQLIDARTDNHIWAQSYQRRLDNVFGIEGEVAQKVADALNAKLSPAQSAALATVPTTNQAAYDLFLRAEYQANQQQVTGDWSDLKAAIPLYRQAVEKDPKFALAWAQLSHTESYLAFVGGEDVDVAALNREALADAGQALKLQPKLPAAQLAVGYYDYYGRKDYAAALKAFAAIVAERPNDADALAAQGYVERRMGRFEDAVNSLGRAAALDPRNFSLALDLGLTYELWGHYAEAETWFQRALALQPDSVPVKMAYSQTILLHSGDVARALAVLPDNDPGLKTQRVRLLTLQRKFPEAIALAESIPNVTQDSANWLGTLYWQAGDKVRARQYFTKALPQNRAALAKVQGLALAGVWNRVAVDEIGLGHTAEGLAAVAKSQAILAETPGTGSEEGAYGNALVYAMAGRADLAVPLLAKLLAPVNNRVAGGAVLLWLDPGWDPIRHDPRFQALLTQYAKYKPAVTYPAPSAAT